MVFGCKNHRDPVKTNFGYVSVRKFKVVSNKITLGSPKCSNPKRQEKKSTVCILISKIHCGITLTPLHWTIFRKTVHGRSLKIHDNSRGWRERGTCLLKK